MYSLLLRNVADLIAIITLRNPTQKMLKKELKIMLSWIHMYLIVLVNCRTERDLNKVTGNNGMKARAMIIQQFLNIEQSGT